MKKELISSINVLQVNTITPLKMMEQVGGGGAGWVPREPDFIRLYIIDSVYRLQVSFLSREKEKERSCMI